MIIDVAGNVEQVVNKEKTIYAIAPNRSASQMSEGTTFKSLRSDYFLLHIRGLFADIVIIWGIKLWSADTQITYA